MLIKENTPKHEGGLVSSGKSPQALGHKIHGPLILDPLYTTSTIHTSSPPPPARVCVFCMLYSSMKPRGERASSLPLQTVFHMLMLMFESQFGFCHIGWFQACSLLASVSKCWLASQMCAALYSHLECFCT